MELNVRDWLIILGSLVAAGFILDAYRRVRAGYSDKLRLSAAKQRDDDEELSNPELPGGGARIVPRSKTVPSYEKALDDAARATVKHQDSDEDGQVPVLMDSVDVVGDEPGDEPESIVEEMGDAEAAAREDAASSLGELALEPGEALLGSGKSKPSTAAPEKPDSSAREPSPEAKPKASNKEPDEFIVLHVVAAGDGLITGSALLQILLACDVRYGRMNIFHRYEESGGAGAEQFSVVNMVAPGTFDLDDMDNFSSPGVSFFMKLPGPKEAIKAFDCMVETAQCLIKNLDCELHDEAHSVVTPQTLQHLRQRIRDFERRQLTLV